jgi:hypothetical protein
MNVEDTDSVTKISIEDISSHQTETVEVIHRAEADTIPNRENAIKIPLDNIVKK